MSDLGRQMPYFVSYVEYKVLLKRGSGKGTI